MLEDNKHQYTQNNHILLNKKILKQLHTRFLVGFQDDIFHYIWILVKMKKPPFFNILIVKFKKFIYFWKHVLYVSCVNINIINKTISTANINCLHLCSLPYSPIQGFWILLQSQSKGFWRHCITLSDTSFDFNIVCIFVESDFFSITHWYILLRSFFLYRWSIRALSSSSNIAQCSTESNAFS